MFAEADAETTDGSTGADSDATSDVDTAETTSDPSTSGGLPTSGVTTTDEASTSGTDGSSSGSSLPTDGGPPLESCWETDRAWTWEVLDVDRLVGQSINTPTLSPDGLTLYYVGGLPGELRPYQVEREDRSDPFVGGEGLDGWTRAPTDLGQLRVALAGGRVAARVGNDLQIAHHQAGTWTALSPVGFGAGFEVMTDPSIDGVGAWFVFDRREFYDDGNGGSNIWVPYIAEWPMESETPSPPARLELPSFELEHAVLCPTLSPDGDRLLMGGSFPETWATGEAGDLDVFVSERVGGQWSQPERVPTLSSQTQHVCPISITADGCEATLRHFDVPFMGNTFAIALR